MDDRNHATLVTEVPMASAVVTLRPSWRRAVHSCPVPMIIVDLGTDEVIDANGPAMVMFARRDGHQVDLRTHVRIDPRHRHLVELIRVGTLDGFEARVHSPVADHDDIELRVWVRALDSSPEPPDQPRRLAVAVVIEDAGADPTIRPPMARSVRMVAGAVSDEWTCEWVTREVTAVLGYQRDAFVGMPLLALVHPEIAGDLVQALSHAAEKHGGAILRARLRGADERWRTLQLVLSPRADDRSGVMFLLLPADESPAHRDPDDLHAQAWRSADDAHTAALARDGDWHGSLPDLSSRQWEIVTRLKRGERVPGIARAMYLSQSTVRNHLTALFRKFGVHSQAELLERLRGVSTDWGRSA
jgi:DNA-binding CsgD family transcriptional regulator